MHATYQNVRERFPAAKAAADRINGPYGHYIMGPIALRLAPWFINHGFSANAVTGLGYLALLAGLVFITLSGSHHWGFLVGGLLLNLVILFDHIDGHVARFNLEASRFGTMFDAMLTWLHHALLPICLGWALYASALDPFTDALGFDIPRWVWLYAGAVQMSAHLFSIVVGRKTESLLDGQTHSERTSGVVWFATARVFVETEALWLIPAAALGVVGLLHLSYALYRSLLLIVTVIFCFRDLAKADRLERYEQE